MLIRRWTCVVATAAGLAAMAAPKAALRTWNLDAAKAGDAAAEFESKSGEWRVIADESAPSKPHVLAQLGKGEEKEFNLLLLKDTVAKDVDFQVKFKTVAGAIDQGGGIVCRAKDEKNYYLFRYNPLESNIRLYKVINGERVVIHSVEDVIEQPGWQTMRIVTNGTRLEGHLYGEARFSITNEAISEPGRVGLWTKADAQTHFDDLQLDVMR